MSRPSASPRRRAPAGTWTTSRSRSSGESRAGPRRSSSGVAGEASRRATRPRARDAPGPSASSRVLTPRRGRDGRLSVGSDDREVILAEHREPEDPLLAELARLELADDLTRAHDEDTVAHRDHLGKLRRDQQPPGAVLDELVDQPVDLELRADVDAARRLVEDDDLGSGLTHEPLPERHLLLVAAAQVPRGQLRPRRADAETPDGLVGEPPLLGRPHDAGAGDVAERGEADVAADAVLQDQSF